MGEYADDAIDLALNGDYGDYITEDDGYYAISYKKVRKNLAKSTKVYASGKLYWAKIVGDGALHLDYDQTGKQWAVEFAPNDTTFLKDHKLLDRLKNKDDAKNPNKGPYIILKKPELNRDGEKNSPFRIWDADGNEWDERLIGNGTDADVKLDIRDWGVGKKQSIYCTDIRITDLVSFSSSPFGAMDEAKGKPPKAKAAKASTAELDDLSDDVPF